MAKYIKTEEGYKTLDELNLALIAGDYIEIKDNIIRSTFGDPAMVEDDTLKLQCNLQISRMYYEPNIESYISEEFGEGFCPMPNIGDELKIVIRNADNTILISDYVTATSQTFVRIGDLRISWYFYNISSPTLIINHPSSLNGCTIKIYKKTQNMINGQIKLPNTALTFDNVPTMDSDNLLTSGTIYDIINTINAAISKINSRIDSIS